MTIEVYIIKQKDENKVRFSKTLRDAYEIINTIDTKNPFITVEDPIPQICPTQEPVECTTVTATECPTETTYQCPECTTPVTETTTPAYRACSEQPCQYGGSCVDHYDGGFHCICSPGYTQPNCTQSKITCFSPIIYTKNPR